MNKRISIAIMILLSAAIILSASIKKGSSDKEEPYIAGGPRNVIVRTEIITGIVVSSPAPTTLEETTTAEVKRYYDVSLSEELQDYIIDLCDQRSISPALVMAIIEQESNCNSEVVGDGGDSLGLMQIQPRWHQWRMDKLGGSDWLNPYDNVAVGIDILADLFSKYGDDVYMVLMAYNGGCSYAEDKSVQGIISDYAIEVDVRAAELEKMLEK